MLDLNDIRVFEKVATLRSFTAAAKALGCPSPASAAALLVFKRTLALGYCNDRHAKLALTDPGVAFHQRCADVLGRVGEMVDYIRGR